MNSCDKDNAKIRDNKEKKQLFMVKIKGISLFLE